MKSWSLNTQRIPTETRGRVLSDEDRDLVLNLLENTPEPGVRLQNLLLSAQKRIEATEGNCT